MDKKKKVTKVKDGLEYQRNLGTFWETCFKTIKIAYKAKICL